MIGNVARVARWDGVAEDTKIRDSLIESAWARKAGRPEVFEGVDVVVRKIVMDTLGHCCDREAPSIFAECLSMFQAKVRPEGPRFRDKRAAREKLPDSKLVGGIEVCEAAPFTRKVLLDD